MQQESSIKALNAGTYNSPINVLTQTKLFDIKETENSNDTSKFQFNQREALQSITATDYLDTQLE